jgi:CelD/BcsL family acetyltransferase involved in cellulose biosynthesis
MTETISYPDLAATVSDGVVPEDLVAELPSLYDSLFSTPGWFRLLDDVAADGALVLADPRHILLFRHESADTIDILNRFFEISPDDLRRACLALFRAFPQARRIHVEVLFATPQLRLPKLALSTAEHMVIELPSTVEDYEASLGKRTRNNLRNFQNRLHRDFPDFSTGFVAPHTDMRDLFAQFLAWKTSRFQSRGVLTYWEANPELAERFLARLHDGGEAQVTTLAGRPAAVKFVFRVGQTVHALQSAFDPAYAPYRLGFVTSYLLACDSVNRGAKRVNLLWGTTEYKTLLGARPVSASIISVFRSQPARLRYAGEAAGVARREFSSTATQYYWRGRHAVRRAVDRFRPNAASTTVRKGRRD